jgi:hypothetical protein
MPIRRECSPWAGKLRTMQGGDFVGQNGVEVGQNLRSWLNFNRSAQFSLLSW